MTLIKNINILISLLLGLCFMVSALADNNPINTVESGTKINLNALQSDTTQTLPSMDDPGNIDSSQGKLTTLLTSYDKNALFNFLKANDLVSPLEDGDLFASNLFVVFHLQGCVFCKEIIKALELDMAEDDSVINNFNDLAFGELLVWNEAGSRFIKKRHYCYNTFTTCLLYTSPSPRD